MEESDQQISINKTYAVIAVIAVIIVGGILIYMTQNQDDTNTSNEASQEVLARVNGEAITAAEAQALQQSPQVQSQEQAVEELVNVRVLEDAAQAAGHTTSPDEVENQLKAQLAQQNASLEEYKAQLEEQGVSFEDQVERYQAQFSTQKFLQAQIEGEDFNVSDEEVQQFYDQFAAQSPENQTPDLSEVEEQIKQQLVQRKQQQVVQQIVQDLREDANITYE